jgi:hypothetical protein
MKRRIVGAAALGACLVLAFLFVGWCRSLGPDVEGAKREVERVIPEHMQVVSINRDHCGLSIAARCSIGYTLRGDPFEYLADGRLIRANLLEADWTETGYTEGSRTVVGFARKGSMTITFLIVSPELVSCELSTCQSRITVTPR